MTEAKVIEWTLDGVLEEIINVHNNMKDRHYAFILGAGASKSSGINTGQELAQRWLEEIYRRECLDKASSIEEWLASGNSGFSDSTISYAHAGNHYPQIFERRFYGDREAGYAALEDAIEGKIPSLGYSLLASIIQETRHKVVITTNFDNLVADALSMQAHQSPLIVAHESLAGFVRPNLRRPLVAKIHRDLFLSPKNDHTGVSTMEESWKEALKKIFQHYTPIVIGYGGNDGSLMDMLNDLPEGSISGRIFWCCRDSAIPQKAKDVLIKHKGVLTKIAGFDEFMLQLAEKLVPDFIVEKIPETLEHLGKTRAQDYREQIKKITQSSTDETIRKIVLDSANKHDDWWSWQLKIDAETDPDKCQALYEEAIRKLPNSSELIGYYANFLTETRKDYDKAEVLYQKAIALDPNQAITIGNYALFLCTIRKDYDKAEALYQKAIALDHNSAITTGNYANFLSGIRKDYDKAEVLFRKAIALDPNDADLTGNYAIFLDITRKDYDKAEALYQKTIELNPNHANITGNYAMLLSEIRKDYDKAEALYQKTLELDPNHANNTIGYAHLLQNIHKNYDKAEALLTKAIELNPSHAGITGHYADFLKKIRKNYNKAEEFFRKSIELDPNHAGITGCYADLLSTIREDYDKAEALYQKAIELDPNDANCLANYSYLLTTHKTAKAAQLVNQNTQHIIKTTKPEPTQALAEALLYACLTYELFPETIKTNPLPRLKSLINIGFERGDWNFEHLFDAVLPDLNDEKQKFYRALGDAILDESNVKLLENFTEWKDCEKIDVFADIEDSN